MRISIKRTCCFMLVCMMVWGSAHFALADQYMAQEMVFAHAESLSGMVEVPGLDEPIRYYAQNDALWTDLVYERLNSSKRRPFRDSGCSPSSLAMAIARLVPEEELIKISEYCKYPYSLCECSINEKACRRHSGRYYLTTERDYVRFLPLVLADFATGNNTWGVCSRSDNSGTGTGYIGKVCQVYGLEYCFSTNYQDAIDAVNTEGCAVFALASGGGCFTNEGHYIYFAHADEEKLYVLDPLARSTYEHCNRGSYLDILQPGLVTIYHESKFAALYSNYVIIYKPGMWNADK